MVHVSDFGLVTFYFKYYIIVILSAFYVKTAIVFEGNSFLKIKTPLSSNKSLLAKKYFFIETKYQKLKMNENNQEKINP